MEKIENGSKWKVSALRWGVLIVIIVAIVFCWGWHKNTHNDIAPTALNVSEGKISHRANLCPSEKPRLKKAKLKTALKKEPAFAPVVSVLTQVLPVIQVPPEVKTKPLLDGVDADFGKTKMVFTPLPEKEAEPPKVGRKIFVIRQQPMMPYYSGYSSSYYPSYAPQVTYGQPYIPPPQAVFVPAPPVIVPAPSFVTPAPSVVSPIGGHRPQGTTGGHSPGGTTGTAL